MRYFVRSSKESFLQCDLSNGWLLLRGFRYSWDREGRISAIPRRCCVLAFHLNGGDESISPARQSFDEARTGGGIPEHVADLVYGGVKAVIIVNERVVGPQALANRRTRHDLAWLLEEHHQDVEWLPLQRHAAALLAQFSGLQVSLKDPEAEQPLVRNFTHLR